MGTCTKFKGGLLANSVEVIRYRGNIPRYRQFSSRPPGLLTRPGKKPRRGLLQTVVLRPGQNSLIPICSQSQPPSTQPEVKTRYKPRERQTGAPEAQNHHGPDIVDCRAYTAIYGGIDGVHRGVICTRRRRWGRRGPASQTAQSPAPHHGEQPNQQPPEGGSFILGQGTAPAHHPPRTCPS